MQEANKNRITVIGELSSDTLNRYDNSKKMFMLEQGIGEAKNPDVEVIEGKQNLYFRNKKTGYGYFIHFD